MTKIKTPPIKLMSISFFMIDLLCFLEDTLEHVESFNWDTLEHTEMDRKVSYKMRNSPANLFWSKTSIDNWVQLVSEERKSKSWASPFPKLLPEKWILSSLFNRPKVRGIGPSKAFHDISNICNSVRLDIEDGKVPVNWFSPTKC